MRLDEFFALKHFDIFQISDHGVFIKIMRGNMFEDFVGHFGSSDDLDFCISRLRVPWADASFSFPAGVATGVPSSAENLNFFRQAILDIVIADDDDTLHENRMHEWPLPLLFDFVFFHLVVQKATINLKAVGGL